MLYFKYISMTFQRLIVYRIEYFTSLLNAFLYIFIFVSVWQALIPESGTENGITRELMVSYAIWSTVIKSTFVSHQSLISSKIKTGEIAVDLMKPFSIPLMYLSDLIGRTLYQIFARAIPLLIFSYFIFEVELGMPLERWYKFFPVYTLSFLIYFLISWFISSFSFFFEEIFPLWIFYFALVTLLSGAIIPIDFFPEEIRLWIVKLPFPYLYYFPTMILLRNQIFLMSYIELLGRYFFFIIILFLLSYFVYRQGLRKLAISGG